MAATIVDLIELGRRGRRQELEQQAQAARSTAGWAAGEALALACAWLLADDPRRADLAYLEADRLDPSLALVPDVWGLWPAPAVPAAAAADPGRQAALERAECFRAWRHPDPQHLWRQLLPTLQADWRQALEPEAHGLLLILGRASAAGGAPPLDPPLEPTLATLVADAEIAAEPAASSRYWQLLATIRPEWDLARIRAADLALARGELEASGRWLADPPIEAHANPWFHDVVARHAVQRGAVAEALEAWAEAIRAARGAVDTAGLEELFEQRRREARRGPGVLQVRSLANRGDITAALALLERLLAEDPQWQPLRSLQEQLRREAGVVGDQAPQTAPAVAEAPELEGFTRLLDRASARLQAMGHPIPAPAPRSETDLPGLAAELGALERRLSDYEARFALA